MGDLPNKRYGARASDTSAQSFDPSKVVKEEFPDEDIFNDHTVEQQMVDLEEASSSSCSNKDPLTDEIEIGDTGITFQQAIFTIHDFDIKAEPITVDTKKRIEDNDDILETSPKRRKRDETDANTQESNFSIAAFSSESSTRTEPRHKVPKTTSTLPNNDSSINEAILQYLRRMENEIKELRQTLKSKFNEIKTLINSGTNSTSEVFNEVSTRNHFDFEIIKSEEELVSFEERLATEEYFESILSWLTSRIKRDHPSNRMHDCLDLLFDKYFFGRCTWTGYGRTGPKVKFSDKTNVFKLIRFTGRCDYGIPTIDAVSSFLKLKLKHASARTKNSFTRRSSCIMRRNKTND
ncbi:uncharacterized protein LOC128304146 [Anopheles moucheti]|uniref:uncharacterized protein LOC128304146 n=1 Tax=Anopheles moucheti TaxID=186751 RepID=UPI0022F06419|nr:uncharacterized protein LOC128304146 [Anopheles moucheti]